MNTPAHLIIGTAVFANPSRHGTYVAALLGALAPDVSLYVMVAVSIWGMGISAETVFRELYYSDAWQQVFAVDNSFVLWSALLALGIWQASPRAKAFAGGGLLHLAFDFPLHTHDARMHFWPVSDWVFESPVSYWDRSAHAGIFGPIEFALSLICAVWIWRRFQQIAIRALTALLLIAETLSTGVWQFVFEG